MTAMNAAGRQGARARSSRRLNRCALKAANEKSSEGILEAGDVIATGTPDGVGFARTRLATFSGFISHSRSA